jgi:hypothetical protein
MNTIKIDYDNDTDETGIEFSDEFNSLPPEQQLDAIRDGLDLLETRYNRLILDVPNLWDTYQRLHDRSRDKTTKRYVKDMWGDKTNGV